jgi:hypothetical protein
MYVGIRDGTICDVSSVASFAFIVWALETLENKINWYQCLVNTASYKSMWMWRNCSTESYLLTYLLSPSLFYLLVHSRCRGFLWFHLITLKHTPHSVRLLWTRDRPVAETSIWQHKHCTRQTSMPPVGYEPAIPATARPQTNALNRAATGIGFTQSSCDKSQMVVTCETQIRSERRGEEKVEARSSDSQMLGVMTKLSNLR